MWLAARTFRVRARRLLGFDFSFSNTVEATVTGEIDGLQDNATGPARQIPGSCGRAATVKGSRIVV